MACSTRVHHKNTWKKVSDMLIKLIKLLIKKCSLYCWILTDFSPEWLFLTFRKYLYTKKGSFRIRKTTIVILILKYLSQQTNTCSESVTETKEITEDNTNEKIFVCK